MNNVTSVGWTFINVFNQIVSFLALGASIGGLVICILFRNLSKSMIMCIVGFGGEIAVWVLQHLVGALGGLGALGQEGAMLIGFFNAFIGLLGPISTALIVFGLYRVFTDMRNRARGRPSAARRRLEEEDEDYDDRPAPRSKKSGSRDVER
jgi:hypothetical protein